MAAVMRAKMRVSHVQGWDSDGGAGETLTFNAVGKSEAYPDDGSDENNTYSRFTPSAELKIAIQNPELIGKFEVGQAYYLDFTIAE